MNRTVDIKTALEVIAETQANVKEAVEEEGFIRPQLVNSLEVNINVFDI